MKYYFVSYSLQEQTSTKYIGYPENESRTINTHPLKWIKDYNAQFFYNQPYPRRQATLLNYHEISEEEYKLFGG